MVADTDWKVLFANSGNECAFPGCSEPMVEPGNPSVVLGEVCHLVAESRQGPRGREEIAEADRDRSVNLILLCKQHHKLIDARPEVYSVGVLRQMKADHEASFFHQPVDPLRMPTGKVIDTLYSSVLSVRVAPSVVFGSRCQPEVYDERDLPQHLDWTRGRRSYHPFILRDRTIWTFTDLRSDQQPFHEVTDRPDVNVLRAQDLWGDQEGHRRYVTLLNKGLRRYLTSRRSLRYDPDHYRFWFPALQVGQNRKLKYVTKTGRNATRDVVHQRVRRETGEATGEFWHTAAELAFAHIAARQWCLTIRPEFHLTTDGETPFDPGKIGRRVTRKKSRMYNEAYLNELHFWRWWIGGGQPLLKLRLGSQFLWIDTDLITSGVSWPGVPQDSKPFTNTRFTERLFPLDEDLTGEDDLDEEEDLDYDECGDEQWEDDELETGE